MNIAIKERSTAASPTASMMNFIARTSVTELILSYNRMADACRRCKATHERPPIIKRNRSLELGNAVNGRRKVLECDLDDTRWELEKIEDGSLADAPLWTLEAFLLL